MLLEKLGSYLTAAETKEQIIEQCKKTIEKLGLFETLLDLTSNNTQVTLDLDTSIPNNKIYIQLKVTQKFPGTATEITIGVKPDEATVHGQKTDEERYKKFDVVNTPIDQLQREFRETIKGLVS
ncbi:MAG: hypothetical protein G01um10145_604 [Microgenomates group bacterium Gr01-1014_5]|nr:MAG: hypothetical protein G01um10145_604 [Microgenomates group bacterium Gr01-1014_5]